MWCKHCGAEIIRIHTMGGPAVCWASPIIYWPVQDGEARGLLTPNGNNVYGNLTGELEDAVGVGYLPHSCHQMLLILQGHDCWGYIEYEKPLTDATATELNEWFDAQLVEDRHFCHIYDRVRMVHILDAAICGSNQRNGGQMIRRTVSPGHRCFPKKNPGTEWGDKYGYL